MTGWKQPSLLQKRQVTRKIALIYGKKGFFSSQICDFSLEKANLPENTTFYLSYKGNNKIYYEDIFIVGQIVPLLKQPEKLDEYEPKENEVKIICAIYDTVVIRFSALKIALAI